MGFFSTIKKAVASSSTVKVVNATSKTTTTSTKKTTTNNKKTNNKTNNTNNTAAATPQVQVSNTDIVTWSGAGGISFFVKPNVIQGIKEMTVKASVNGEEKENGGDKYTTKKTNGAIEITLKAILNGYLGVDVRTLALTIIDSARTGDTGYFYSYGKKLFTSQFMMAEAEAGDIQMNSKGDWSSCTVTMKLKQSSKGDGSTAAASSGNNKKKTTTTKIAGALAAIGSAVAAGAKAVKDSIKDSINTTNAAKQESQKLLNQSKQNKTTSVRDTASYAFD